MNEFTNEFALARNYGFDITMPDGNMGLSSAAHMEYMNKCVALYKHFISNMNTIIRTEKEAKKGLSKLHREKMDNLRYSLYRSQNAADGNDPFAKPVEASSVSQTGLDSRNNTPWGLGAVPHEEEEESSAVRPHTAPAGTLKRSDSVAKRNKSSGDAIAGDEDDDEQLSTTGLSNPGTAKDEVILGILDSKSEKKIIVGQHSFAKLCNKSVNVKMKNRDGLFKVMPLNMEVTKDESSTLAYEPGKHKADYDPVNEKLAMVKKKTNYLTPTIASDMKINNKIPIQKSLKGMDAKRTTVVEIYRNSRDRRTRHFRIVTKKQDNSSDSQISPSRLAVMKTKLLSAFSFRGKINNTDISNDDVFRDRADTMSPAGQRASSRVAFAREDSNSSVPVPRDNPSRTGFGRSDSQLSNCYPGILVQKDSTSKHVTRSDSQMSNIGLQPFRERSDSQLSNSRNSSNFLVERKTSNLSESFNSGRRESSFSAAVTASLFVNKLKKSLHRPETTESERRTSLMKPSLIASNMDTKKIVKQQIRKDKELDDQMTTWRRRMTVRSGAMSKSRMKPGGRMKLI